MNRRAFLSAGIGFGAAAMCRGAGLFTAKPSDYDDALTVFLSDVHVCGAPFERWTYTRDELAKRVAAILAMRPLPRRFPARSRSAPSVCPIPRFGLY